ncbi:serine/threonine-protein kinase [Yinghuangia sp. YIM S10712]|uniref:serine/threonine-protein kinase n=1 Tax=Yinghuangia sp. YIM S10712 TaxID=3436930 RepID=UPI003F53CDAA
MEALKPGDPGVVGRYRLSARLAGGRLGTVFLGKARDGGAVTVRLVRPDLAADKRFVERFRKTTEAVRRIDGLHLAHVLDADPDGTPPWLVTEYAPGITLEEAVATHGPLPEDALRVLGSALARALVAVHAAKVVHQGLAAGTVMLTQHGPQIIDLGLPALLGADASTALPAPEQATGGTVTAATDVFALAGVVCQAAGVAPYGSVGAAEIAQKVLRTTPDLDGLPADLAELLARCFARRPDSRPTAAELVELFDGDDAAGTAWLPKGVAAAVEAAARVRPPKPKAAPADAPPKAASPEAERSAEPPKPVAPENASDDDATESVEDGEETVEVGVAEAVPQSPAVPAAAEPQDAAKSAAAPASSSASPSSDDSGDETDDETGDDMTGDDETAPVAAAGTPASVAAEPTVAVKKPLDQPQLLRPRKPPAPPAPDADAAEAPKAARAARAASPTPSAPTEAASPTANAAPTVIAPRWSPAGPAEAAPPAPAVSSPAVPSARPESGVPGAGAAAPAKRQASAAVWYAVIVLVGLTSAGLAVYRLLDSDWRDLQNPVMGLVLPGVSLVFGLAGLVVLALAVNDRRKSSGNAQGTSAS